MNLVSQVTKQGITKFHGYTLFLYAHSPDFLLITTAAIHKITATAFKTRLSGYHSSGKTWDRESVYSVYAARDFHVHP